MSGARFPLCGHDLLCWDDGKPIIDATAVSRFASYVEQTHVWHESGLPVWAAEICREQAWQQAHDQLDMAKRDPSVLADWISRAEIEIHVNGLEGTYVTGTVSEQTQRHDIDRRIARYRRALRFQDTRPIAEQRSAA